MKGQGCQLGTLCILHHKRTNEKGQEACALASLSTTSKGNNVATSSKHSLQTSQDLPSDTQDDDYFVVEEPQHLRVYLPEQIFVAKGLLEEAKAKEKTFFLSKAGMQKEKHELECQVQSLTFKLLDQNKEYDKELKKLSNLEQIVCHW
jgi:hypothetical protein